MAKIVYHSKMGFIYDNVFPIEEQGLNVRLGEGIRTVEFNRCMKSKLVFVEARTTFAQTDGIDISDGTNLQKQTQEVVEKFIHSLNIYAAIKIGVIDEPMSNHSTPDKISIVFVLVVKRGTSQGCRKLSKIVFNQIPSWFTKIWGLKVYAVNGQTAINRGLVADIIDDAEEF